MLTVESFEFHTGLRQLFEPTMRVVEVQVQGMQLNIPPKQERGTMSDKPEAARAAAAGDRWLTRLCAAM